MGANVANDPMHDHVPLDNGQYDVHFINSGHKIATKLLSNIGFLGLVFVLK